MTDTTEALLERGDAHNSPSYAPARLILDRGEGVRLFDRAGNEYLDLVGGIAVNCLGYNHPRLTEALCDQAARLLHVSNLFYTAEQVEAMAMLAERSFADRVFLCNSGAEANEAALKLARRYQREVAGRDDKYEIVTMRQSFHGRTFGAITATGQPKYHAGFEPMVPGFDYADFNDLDDVRAKVGERTAAVVVEPIQGEGGLLPADPAFLEGLRTLCDEVGALLVFDEVQTGVGRTGDLFAYQGYGVAPDIMCLAKGLGGGVPVGAMLSTERVFGGWQKGSHASTFGGNPLASRAVSTVLSVIDDDGLLDNARARGEQLQDGLRGLAERFDVITDVRGRGLMVGAECGDAARDIQDACREAGLLINTAGGYVLRFVPPLVITADDVDEALDRLETALERV